MTWAWLWSAIGGGVALAAVAGAAWVRWRFVSITVEGTSMIPTLRPGDRVLIRRRRRGLRPGQIVVVARPDPVTGRWERPRGRRGLRATSWLVKRVVAIGGEPYPRQVGRDGVVPVGHIALLGDHPVSADSKQFGACPTSQVLGVYVRTWTTRGKAGGGSPAPTPSATP